MLDASVYLHWRLIIVDKRNLRTRKMAPSLHNIPVLSLISAEGSLTVARAILITRPVDHGKRRVFSIEIMVLR